MAIIFEQVVIIGVGLIGGSLGMALRKHQLANQVVGIDLDTKNLAVAKDLGAVDVYDTGYTPVETADLVILAAPVFTNLKILKNILKHLPPHAIVTDVGSTKSEFVAQAEKLLAGRNTFIGGHPMAGAETAGIVGADPYLFENAIYLLTPTEHTQQNALTKVNGLVEQIGAKTMMVDPDTHDLVVAAISHLPHLVAASLVQTAAQINASNPITLALAAGGFKDTTRIASGNPGLWKDICFSNKQRISHVISIFQSNLDNLRQTLVSDSEQEFEENLAYAKLTRDKIPAKLKGYWPFLDEIIVTIPDRPGMIGQVAAILGGKGINIDDIEILRVREGEGGTLRLGFAQIGASKKAVQILNSHGFVTRILSGD